MYVDRDLCQYETQHEAKRQGVKLAQIYYIKPEKNRCMNLDDLRKFFVAYQIPCT